MISLGLHCGPAPAGLSSLSVAAALLAKAALFCVACRSEEMRVAAYLAQQQNQQLATSGCPAAGATASVGLKQAGRPVDGGAISNIVHGGATGISHGV